MGIYTLFIERHEYLMLSHSSEGIIYHGRWRSPGKAIWKLVLEIMGSAYGPVVSLSNSSFSCCFAQGTVRHAKAALPLNR